MCYKMYVLSNKEIEIEFIGGGCKENPRKAVTWANWILNNTPLTLYFL